MPQQLKRLSGAWSDALFPQFAVRKCGLEDSKVDDVTGALGFQHQRKAIYHRLPEMSSLVITIL